MKTSPMIYVGLEIKNFQTLEERVVNSVCIAFYVSEEQLKSKTRKRQVVHARWAIYYLIKWNTKSTLVAIGAVCNAKHDAVWHGLKKVNIWFALKYPEATKVLNIANKLHLSI